MEGSCTEAVVAVADFGTAEAGMLDLELDTVAEVAGSYWEESSIRRWDIEVVERFARPDWMEPVPCRGLDNRVLC